MNIKVAAFTVSEKSINTFTYHNRSIPHEQQKYNWQLDKLTCTWNTLQTSSSFTEVAVSYGESYMGRNYNASFK